MDDGLKGQSQEKTKVLLNKRVLLMISKIQSLESSGLAQGRDREQDSEDNRLGQILIQKRDSHNHQSKWAQCHKSKSWQTGEELLEKLGL